VELRDAVVARRTTNGPFEARRVSLADQRRLLDAASRAPSHFNSQPWRFVLVEDQETIDAVASSSADSMTQLMEEGTFWMRYRRYFRFSDQELADTGDGIHFDRMPRALKPFKKLIFGDTGQAVMNRLGVPRTLGADNRAIVAGSPLLLAAALDRTEYRPGELSGFYSVFGLGAAIENIWLTTTELGMGMQFVSTPMEFPARWSALERLLRIPDDLALMALFRLGYVPASTARPTIDWSSRHRKRYGQFVFREHADTPDDLLDEH
jgi:nitroreductase